MNCLKCCVNITFPLCLHKIFVMNIVGIWFLFFTDVNFDWIHLEVSRLFALLAFLMNTVPSLHPYPMCIFLIMCFRRIFWLVLITFLNETNWPCLHICCLSAIGKWFNWSLVNSFWFFFFFFNIALCCVAGLIMEFQIKLLNILLALRLFSCYTSSRSGIL